jgi:NADH-quinone oxidoreductase subunit C
MKDALRQKLESRFGASIISVSDFRGEMTVVCSKKELVSVCRFLRDDPEFRFDTLRDVCGADNAGSGDRFEVIYNLYSIPNKFRLRLKVTIGEDNLHVPTVSGVWPAANWAERETYDMFGIIFDEHPDLRRIYMPEEFEHHPLRKDFPLMGIPGSLPLPRK